MQATLADQIRNENESKNKSMVMEHKKSASDREQMMIVDKTMNHNESSDKFKM